MRPQNNKRARGRTNRRSPNPNRSYESNGPDGKIRGNANQVYDKYSQLARDASASGDIVTAEGYWQHAEHYYRIMMSMQQNRPSQQSSQNDQQDNDDQQQQPQQQQPQQQNNEKNERNDPSDQDQPDVQASTPRDGQSDESETAGLERVVKRAPRPRRPRRPKEPDNASAADGDGDKAARSSDDDAPARANRATAEDAAD
ncbi:DUF4167 domain-containing protein [Minwuia sp.]|uniref:DUF4167 domain-containing protein n=1 Tax=Minwuia sp. TaxID=2493630 RepID=UPI003A904C01